MSKIGETLSAGIRRKIPANERKPPKVELGASYSQRFNVDLVWPIPTFVDTMMECSLENPDEFTEEHRAVLFYLREYLIGYRNIVKEFEVMLL